MHQTWKPVITYPILRAIGLFGPANIKTNRLSTNLLGGLGGRSVGGSPRHLDSYTEWALCQQTKDPPQDESCVGMPMLKLPRENLRDLLAVGLGFLGERARHGGDALGKKSSNDDGKLHIDCVEWC